jgi:quinol-cytochrome oxidoreductase complex cytochrome b subunit
MHPTHHRRRPWPTVLLLLVTAAVLALLAVVLIAPPAGALALGLPAQVRRAPGSSPPPWPAGAALLAMAVVAIPTIRARPDPFDDPDPPGGP